METKMIGGIAGGLVLAFVLAFAFQSLSAYRDPNLLVINQTNTNPALTDRTCTYTVYEDSPIVNNNYTYYANDCNTGQIISSSMNASKVFNDLSVLCNTNNGCYIHVKGYSNSNNYRAYNITKAVLIPNSGHYNVVGEGTEFTTFRVPSGYDNNVFQFSGNKTANSFFNSWREFSMTGNNAGTTNSGFVFNGTNFGITDSLIDNVFLRNFKQDDIYMNGVNCWNNKIEMGTIELAGRAGLYITGGLTCQDVKVHESKFLFNNQFGIYTDATSETHMGNWFYKNNQTAVKLNGASSIVIVGDRFLDNGIQTTNTYYDLWVLGSANVITDNRFLGAEVGVNKVKYGIFLDTFENSNIVTGNSFGSQFGTAKLFAGTTSQHDNLVVNNIAFNPVGKITNPFFTSGNTIIVSGGGSATPNNATLTTNTNTPIYITITGGTTVSIELQDNAGNVIQTGLTTITQQEIPFGYKIKVTWHTIPTFTVYAQ